ncbi:MAG: response regulator [Candidatus Eremiobacterota bacterium]
MSSSSDGSSLDPERHWGRAVKILVVDDDPNLLRMVQTLLSYTSRGYEVFTAGSGQEALEVARREVPDLILLDLMMPEMDGIEVCRRLRQHRLTYLIPVVMLTASGQGHRLDALRTGVDDYLAKPFDPAELEARIEGLVLRFRQTRASNPLTGLPGNFSIEQEITRRILRDEKMAVCYVDVDNFKAYNDKYGFEKGDECLQCLARILVAAAEEVGQPDDFVGHIGGDDFIYITSPDHIDRLLKHVIERFDSRIPGYYDDEDRKRGYIEVTNRQGQTQRFPMMTLSIGVATNVRRRFTSALQVSEIAAETKSAAKSSKDKSNYVVDRRSQ